MRVAFWAPLVTQFVLNPPNILLSEIVILVLDAMQNIDACKLWRRYNKTVMAKLAPLESLHNHIMMKYLKLLKLYAVADPTFSIMYFDPCGRHLTPLKGLLIDLTQAQSSGAGAKSNVLANNWTEYLAAC